MDIRGKVSDALKGTGVKIDDMGDYIIARSIFQTHGAVMKPDHKGYAAYEPCVMYWGEDGVDMINRNFPSIVLDGNVFETSKEFADHVADLHKEQTRRSK